MLIGGLGIHRGSFLLENSFLIDWLSFTIPLASILDLKFGSIKNLLHELGLDFPFDMDIIDLCLLLILLTFYLMI